MARSFHLSVVPGTGFLGRRDETIIKSGCGISSQAFPGFSRLVHNNWRPLFASSSDRATHSTGSDPSSSEPQITESSSRFIAIKCKEVVSAIDEFLKAGDDVKALETARKHLNGGLRAFGTAQQVPLRTYTLEELRLHKIDTSKFLSPKDSTLDIIKRVAQIALGAGLVAAWQGLELDQSQLLGVLVTILFIGTTDQVANSGGGEALILDSLGNFLSSKYRDRVALHEAGHFLIAYLVGILPRDYTLNSWHALQKYGALNVQAGTTFVDFEFTEEIQKGKLKSETLGRFACIALAGVSTEYLRFGVAEGGLTDVLQLDALFRSLGFTQKKADSQVRWAVLNTVTLLRRHANVHTKLAEAMKASMSVGSCIEVIERTLDGAKDV